VTEPGAAHSPVDLQAARLIEAVIFDMDGVLVDSEPVHAEATRLVLADHGIVYEGGDDFFGFTDEEVFRVLRARHRLAADVPALARAWVDRVVPLLAPRLHPMAGVPDVLEDLRVAGYRLALASGSAPPIIAETLRALGIAPFFEHVVSAQEVGRGKPAPDIFVEVARRMGVGRGRCLVVEDSRNGLLSAVAAGMPCAVVPCTSTAGQVFTDATVRLARLGDLPGWLNAFAERNAP
jgi:HAD superfamily hydrolase (TIGR01509 family)